ncbi:hypothetical protein [Streptomyces sp. MP131-18]|uniref:hypothetical protein n=1 Tax=Streptomyces sp. MP131-18 TaxID=1857892 RepID=UPI00097C9051|nr:hypothetical protein [Streptomyces sp. MP131-18]ONK13781.1 hypothetical protein STBA_45540 [Streptomyces sp. MP131-18]
MPPEPAELLHFTRDDVEAATEGGKKPWTRQAEFADEINAEDIAAAAAAYGRAAAEARGAQDLAVRATELAAQGGELDGTALVDGEARIDATRGGLQDGGADIDAVVGHLVYAMNLALATEDDVRGLIHNPQGLDTKYVDHLRTATEEWNGWVQALNEAQAAQSDLMEGFGIWLTGEPVPLSLTHPITQETRLARLTSAGWELPPDLAGQIRDKYLRLAATDAAATADDIEAEIERYRRRLAERADELGRLGHDVSAGPLGLWNSPGEGRPDLTRQDNDFYAQQNHKGQRKSHLNADGDLVPANPTGAAGIVDHVVGKGPIKSDSPFTSLSREGAAAKDFGNSYIRVDLPTLEQDIAAGRVQGVEIYSPEEVQAAIQGSADSIAGRPVDVTVSPHASRAEIDELARSYGLSEDATNQIRQRIIDMKNTQRDEEWLIRGTVPNEYVDGPFGN